MLAIASRSSASSASSAGPRRFGNEEERPNYEITISASPEWGGWRASAVFAITAPSEVEAKELAAVVDDTVQSFGGPRSSRSRSARSSGRRERWRPRGVRSFRSLAHHEGGPVKVRKFTQTIDGEDYPVA